MRGIARSHEPEDVKEYISLVLGLIRSCTGTYDEMEQTDIIVQFFRLPPNWRTLAEDARQLNENL